MLKLKDPALIERWEKLVPYVRNAPPVGEFTVLANSAMPQWEFGVRRAHSMPHMAFFMRVDVSDIELLDILEKGDSFNPVMVEYKVDSRVPFIIRRVTMTGMRVGSDGLDLVEKDGPFRGFRALVKFFQEIKSGILEPDVEELDDLLEFLATAVPQDPNNE